MDALRSMERLIGWKKNIPLKVTGIYFTAAVTLLILSELVVFYFIYDSLSSRIFDFVKGLAFIILSSILIFSILNKYIIDKIRADRRLREKEKRLRSIINAMPVFVVLKDGKGNWKEANDPTIQLFQLESYTGKSNAQIARESKVYSNIVEQCSLSDIDTRTMRQPQKYEKVISFPDGQERVYEVTKVPIEYESDETCILVVGKDITESKRVEEELRMTKEELESVISNTADAIVVYDMTGRFLKVNRAFEEMYGWTKEEIYMRSTVDTIPQEYLNEALEIGNLLRAGEQVSGVESVRMKKDGTRFHVSMSFAPVRNKDGKTVAFSGIIRDISERKKAEELLRKSEMLSVIGELAAGVAHEIRNPLTSLKGFIQLIQSGDQVKKKYIDIILSELDRINTIVNEFMVLAKPQVLEFKRRDIHKIIQDVITLIDTQAILHNVEILTIYNSKIPTMMCEENQIKQVLINLLKNSIEAMDDGGKIQIKIDDVDVKHISISVIDQGGGIPEERIPKLGQPFYTTKEKGTGLGLMISYKIIRSHNGHIDIESEVGRGTSVKLTLPLEQDKKGK